ncbi:MAG TPA: chemotaxis protein CheW [Nevskiaceae bacterium]|nr:chemotaxis protein CheW [Nevskiaceae bacterium]
MIFHLAGQHYALAVSALQEVLAWQTPTPVPCAPPNVLGLIHRRGSVVPVVDIRQALGLAVGAPTPHGAMVLLPQALALAVDAIGDVFVPGDDRQPPPAVGTPAPAISALSHHAGEPVVLLDGAALAKAAATRPGTALA